MEKMFEDVIPRKEIPWFPTVDYEACTGCQECINHCPGDVYDWDDVNPTRFRECLIPSPFILFNVVILEVDIVPFEELPSSRAVGAGWDGVKLHYDQVINFLNSIETSANISRDLFMIYLDPYRRKTG